MRYYSLAALFLLFYMGSAEAYQETASKEDLRIIYGSFAAVSMVIYGTVLLLASKIVTYFGLGSMRPYKYLKCLAIVFMVPVSIALSVSLSAFHIRVYGYIVGI